MAAVREVSIETPEFELLGQNTDTRDLRDVSVKPFGYFRNSPQIPIMNPTRGTCPTWSWRTFRNEDGTTSEKWIHDSEDTD
jgi:hypothetical protein